MRKPILDTVDFQASIAQLGGPEAYFERIIRPVLEGVLAGLAPNLLTPTDRANIFYGLCDTVCRAAKDAGIPSRDEEPSWPFQTAIVFWAAVFDEGVKSGLWGRDAEGRPAGFRIPPKETKDLLRKLSALPISSGCAAGLASGARLLATSSTALSDRRPPASWPAWPEPTSSMPIEEHIHAVADAALRQGAAFSSEGLWKHDNAEAIAKIELAQLREAVALRQATGGGGSKQEPSDGHFSGRRL